MNIIYLLKKYKNHHLDLHGQVFDISIFEEKEWNYINDIVKNYQLLDLIYVMINTSHINF